MTVFVSWQSDTQGNRDVIFGSVNAEVQKINEEGKLEIKVDQATRDLPGAPKIEDAILDKIIACDLFLCDITPVIKLNDEKEMPNSNVLIELGFAIKTLGWDRIILVAKQGDWKDKDLPFDINHHRISKFHSSKDCNLQFEIDSCVKYCLSHRKKGFKQSIIKTFSDLIEDQKSLNKPHNSIKVEKPIYTATEDATVFFARRMAAAFPGVRGLEEFTSKKEIHSRLSILLAEPLKFQEGYEHACTVPVWWFRCGSAMDISQYKRIDRNHSLLNFDELNIKRIVAFRDSGLYYREYVYVETYPDPQCGLYQHDSEYIKERFDSRGDYDEEYALFKPSRWQKPKPINRNDYDDGATMYRGRIVELKGRSQLRIRHITPYNFVIAAQNSPYNSHEFDRISGECMVEILKGNMTVQQFHNQIIHLERRDNDYL